MIIAAIMNTATLQTVIGVHVSAGDDVKEVYVRLPVSTKTSTVDVVRTLVAKNFGDEDPAKFALYEADYVKRACTFSPIFISNFISFCV